MTGSSSNWRATPPHRPLRPRRLLVAQRSRAASSAHERSQFCVSKLYASAIWPRAILRSGSVRGSGMSVSMKSVGRL